MSSQIAMSIMGVAEVLLWTVLGILFWRKKLQRRFQVLSSYIVLRAVTAPVFAILLFGIAHGWMHGNCYFLYFYSYWLVYFVSAAMLYFVCVEVFRAALLPYKGLLRLGTVAFRWAALVSLIVSFSTVSLSRPGLESIKYVGFALMRSVSIMELCLLGFLCLSMSALRLSARDMTFGISLVLGIMSSLDFILTSLMSHYSSMTAPIQFVYEALTLVALGLWIGYCAIPEPVRKPFVVPVSSTVYRWNEIASALGHSGTRVAVQQPSTGFFLTDVERVVEKVLARNMKIKENES